MKKTKIGKVEKYLIIALSCAVIVVSTAVLTFSYYAKSTSANLPDPNRSFSTVSAPLIPKNTIQNQFFIDKRGLVRGKSKAELYNSVIGKTKEFKIGGTSTLRGEVIDFYEVPSPKAVKSRVTVIKAENFKYDKVRIEETYQFDEDGEEQLLSTTTMVADHVIVKVLPDVDEEELRDLVNSHGLKIRRKMYSGNMYLVETPEAEVNSVPDALASLSSEEEIRISDPDYIVYSISTPDDASFSNLWGMHNTGQTGGTPDADIDAVEAWDQFTGSRSVLVGVIDTGINYNHPDLADNIWTNPDEIAGNGIDDDGNGLIDDIHGYDFVNNDGDPDDDHAHGSHCAGTIGGVGNNGTGVAGVNWEVTMIGLKFLSASGSGVISDAIECVNYATDKGVSLTSNSWGGGGFSSAMQDALIDANANDILFIAAAGNSSSNNDNGSYYPSGYEIDNVISVAATDHNDQLANFSSYGATTVDLGAPGVSVYSTVLGSGYSSFSGTSMATPHVAGVCALLKGFDPSLTADQIKFIVLNSGDQIPSLAGITLTGRRLNALNTLNMAGDSILVLNNPTEGKNFISGMNVEISWASLNLTGNIKIELLKDGSVDTVITSNTENDGDFDWVIPNGFPVGNYVLKVTSVDDSSFSDQNNISIVTENFPNSLAGWVQSPGSNASWSIASDYASQGVLSLKSDDIGDNETAAIEFTGNFKSGVITFDKKVASESNYDYLVFYIDGVEQARWSGSVDWSNESYAVSEGIHTFKWVYEKDFIISTGLDCAWIDEVSLPAINNAPVIDVAASASPASIPVNGITDLAVEASDIDGDMLFYSWEKISGPGDVTFSASNDATTTAGFSEEGTYELQVTVSDSQLQITNSVSVTVTEYELISETGSFNIQQNSRTVWHSVALNKVYQNPVVIFSPVTTNGNQPAHIRVKNVTGNSFEWQIEEWDYLDGYHLAEKVDYIVLEAGTYTLPDGRKFVAGNIVSQDSYTSHTLADAFQLTPIVVAQLVSAQDATPATVRLNNIQLNSFDIKLQSEEANGKVHGDEIVSYIAVEPGSYQNGGLLESDTTGVSVDHNWFNLKFNETYEKTPSFFASFQTTRGGDTADLRIRNLSGSQVDVKVHEEQSKDSEIRHFKEKLGYILFDLSN